MWEDVINSMEILYQFNLSICRFEYLRESWNQSLMVAKRQLHTYHYTTLNSLLLSKLFLQVIRGDYYC